PRGAPRRADARHRILPKVRLQRRRTGAPRRRHPPPADVEDARLAEREAATRRHSARPAPEFAVAFKVLFQPADPVADRRMLLHERFEADVSLEPFYRF